MNKSQKKERQIFENCKWHKVALKIAYDGQNYSGFEKCPTAKGNAVEDHLFDAMRRIKIINTEEPE
jgi:tRNA U38,U39,U40 pseudouridine synthase TruA